MLTDRMDVVAQYWFDKLMQNKEALGLADVYYGDQERVATTPVVCVEPDTKGRLLRGVPRKTDVSINLFFLVYHSAVRSPQSNRKAADTLAEDLEMFVHEDPRMSDSGEDLVIHCMITRIDSGYVKKENTVMRASRLTLDVTTQALLPS